MPAARSDSPAPTTETPLARALLARVNRQVEQLCAARERINLMEVCGTHTMAISSFGIRRAVDQRLKLLSGPGCPVCVTAQEEIDACVALAQMPGVAVVTFGDMLRVPGTEGSLEQARAEGADVRVVYSALDALRLAEAEPGREFVFLGVGFETTAPTIAAAVLAARDSGVGNFSVLALFKTIPQALELIAGSGRVRVDGFILPGHVATITGTAPFQFLRDRFRLPSCVVGFEALDVLQGISMLLEQLERGPEVAIQYKRSVRPEGNRAALEMLATVFEPRDASWRGIGTIPMSGLGFRKDFKQFDASRRFRVRPGKPRKTACRCGDVMLGVIAPNECPLFDKGCTPETPVGPCMVSSEGACAAWYKYER
jgi:hydrogenase expression/formation protein HypD